MSKWKALGRAAALAVLAVTMIAGCAGGGAPGGKPADEQKEPTQAPRPSLLGTWTAPSTCTLPNNEQGTGSLTMTFGETRWYVYRHCEAASGAHRYRGDGGTWSIDGDVVTRTRLRGDEVETASKAIVWADDGKSFKVHPFHWSGDDRPTARRTYTLVSRGTLPVADIEGDWFIRWNNEPHTRFTFNQDGSFSHWGRYNLPDGNSGRFTTTGRWRRGDAGDGTLYLSGIEVSGEDTRFPGQVIRASSSTEAEIGIAPGPTENTLVIWWPVVWIPSSNVPGFSPSVPTAQVPGAHTNVLGFKRLQPYVVNL